MAAVAVAVAAVVAAAWATDRNRKRHSVAMPLSTRKGLSSGARPQGGQAMVFTLLFGAAAGLVTLLLFNSGLLANAKTRLQNAADAGAYSAALLQARDHNFSAYTNRAMVANQVAVVQLVSIKSFLQDAADTHERMGEGLLAFEASTFPSSKTAWDRAKALPIQGLYNNFAAAAPVAVTGLDRLIKAHETAQEAHHDATVLGMALVANEVVQRNDPGAEMTNGMFRLGRTNVQVTNWGNATTRHRANDESSAADRFADVVVSDKSTDRFTRFRPSSPVPRWNSTIKWCRILPNYVRSNTNFTFAHAGASQLSKDKKRWLALDATTGAGSWSCTVWYPCWTGICTSSVTGPHIDGNFGLGGSGGGLAGRNGDYDSLNGYRNNPGTTTAFGGAVALPGGALRYFSEGPGNSLDGAGGLQDYYRDMANPATSTPANQSAQNNGGAFGFTIEVERTRDTLRTSSRLLRDSQTLRMDDGMAGDTMRALAGGQAYFYRPRFEAAGRFTSAGWARDDGRTEFANQFNPYWQSRLVDRSTADRAASWAAQQ